mmetsp:Transcript_39597/g.67443  ORF Transcript_39597/g.67443 Transcript_39597/m.67443 type:complete len:239 (-) Transcript_39597:598-1314(-)
MPKEAFSPAFVVAWVAATCLCVWFLFIHAPLVLVAKDNIQPLLYIHLFGAYSVYIACVHNTLLTPSTLNGAARPFHIWVGRIGMFLGVVGFFSGFVLVWFIYDYTQNLGFSIGITFGGFSQIYTQIVGYKAIKRSQEIKAKIGAHEYKNEEELFALQDEQDAQLNDHIQSMIGLFVLACGIPALMRICDIVSYNYLPIFIGLAYSLSYVMSYPFAKRIRANRLSERGAATKETSLLYK